MSDFDKDVVVEWFEGLAKYGIHLGLTNITELLDRIGNPQNSFKSIHVAGSDGKGSVCAMLDSVLRESGYSVGLDTSPHIVDFNERIRVNGENISDNDIMLLAYEIMTIVECMKDDGMHCTFFEAMTAMAFMYFQRRGVEYAVIEVGLGGRFDATNVLNPEVCIISNISKEHTDVLGKTVSEIAYEKAGIIKEGVPVITFNTGDAFNTISEVASEKHAECIVTKNMEVISVDMYGSDIRYNGETYRLNIPGSYQVKNASLVIEACMKLSETDISQSLYEGLKNARWDGRMQKIENLPLIIDVTHTTAGMKLLCSDIKEIYGKVNVIIGVLNDKDIAGMSSYVASMAKNVIITAPKTSRALNIDEIVRVMRLCTDNVTVADSVADALDIAMEMEGTALVTGSLRMAEEAFVWLNQ